MVVVEHFLDAPVVYRGCCYSIGTLYIMSVYVINPIYIILSLGWYPPFHTKSAYPIIL